MALGRRGKKAQDKDRTESRIPMEVAVKIDGNSEEPGAEITFTQNVSPNGACVWSNRRWKLNDRITVSTLTGTFHSIARVVYCEAAGEAGFAVGVEFVNCGGTWVMNELQPNVS
jgi:hypothetical protein